jgi:hypothetical protein
MTATPHKKEKKANPTNTEMDPKHDGPPVAFLASPISFFDSSQLLFTCLLCTVIIDIKEGDLEREISLEIKYRYLTDSGH